MRKTIIYTLCILAATSAFAATKTYTGKYTNTAGVRTDLNNTGLNNTTDVILNSTPNEAANTGEMYRGGSNVIMRSMTVVDNSGETQVAGDANIAAAFVIDANSTSDITALSVNNMTLVASASKIMNSASSSAVLNVNFNKLTLNGSGTQSQSLTFDNVTANVVTADYTAVGETAGTSSTLVIGEGSNVNWKGQIYSGKKNVNTPNSGVIINGTLTMDKDVNGLGGIKTYANTTIGSTGTLNVGTGCALTIDGSATLTIAGNINFATGNGFDHYGTLLITNTAPTQQLTFQSISSGSQWTVGKGVLTQSVATGEYTGIRIKRTANIVYGTTWTVNEKLDVGGDATEAAIAKLTVDATSKVNMVVGEGQDARLRLLGNVSVNLIAQNAVTMDDGSSIKLVSEDTAVSQLFANKISFQADQKFSQIIVNSDLYLWLNDGSSLTLDFTEGSTVEIADGKVFTIYNFRDNAVYVGDNLTDSTLAAIKAQDSEGTKYTVSVTDGWLVGAVVPEPAEWAAIFGALALGFALYRRRK